MAFGKTAFGEPVDSYPVQKTPGYLKTRDKTLRSWLEALEGKYSNDWVGIAWHPTQGMFRLGRVAGYPVNEDPGDGLLGPLFANVKRYLITNDGQLSTPISKIDNLHHEDGTPVDRTGLSGQVMTVFNEGSYFNAKLGDYLIWGASEHPMPDLGFVTPPTFEQCTMFANGAYEGAELDGKLCSIAVDPADGISPVWPVTERSGDWGGSGVTLSQLETWGKAQGEDWGNVHYWDIWWRILLFRLRFASFPSQAQPSIGNGRSALSGSWVNDDLIGRCGLADVLPGAFAGSSTGDKLADCNKVDLCENFGGNIWEWVIGYLMLDRQVYTKTAPPYPMNSVDDYEPLLDLEGVPVIMPASDGYLGNPLSGQAFMFDAAHDGTSVSPVGDYIWTNNNGYRVGRSGALSLSSSRVGVSAWNSSNGPSTAYAYSGGRLRFQKRRTGVVG